MKIIANKLALLLALTGLLSACSIVRPGEVGIKQKMGRIKGEIREPGLYMLNPFTTRFLKVPTRTINMTSTLNFMPTKEGLNVTCELAVLFHIKKEKAIHIIETVGLDYGEGILSSVMRSAVADVTAQFLAKDLYTSERHKIEEAIAKRMTSLMGDRGLVVEAVLLKSIQLPRTLSQAIEAKLEAEQRAQAMEFELDRQRSEAERQKIEAEGIRQAQEIISRGLNEMILKYQSIEAFKQLSQSQGAKVIITDGKTPFLINE